MVHILNRSQKLNVQVNSRLQWLYLLYMDKSVRTLQSQECQCHCACLGLLWTSLQDCFQGEKKAPTSPHQPGGSSTTLKTERLRGATGRPFLLLLVLPCACPGFLQQSENYSSCCYQRVLVLSSNISLAKGRVRTAGCDKLQTKLKK